MTGRQILYLSHGGGPLPLLGDGQHEQMVECLRDIAGKLSRPSAILVISAHWEQAIPSVTTAANPPLVYDYYGFPPESYEITYPCPGHPDLAKSVANALQYNGFEVRQETQRGFDHGLFVPLKIMFPEADIPCIQLSLLETLDADSHLKLGASLRDLNFENLLIIGSGFSFHNMRAFFTPATEQSEQMNLEFEDWLAETCSDETMTEEARRARLLDWESAPSARFCHPREEHLLPLQVCYGAAGRSCDELFRLQALGRHCSMVLWSA